MVIRKRKVVSVKNIVVYYNKKRLYLFRKRLSLVKISMIIEKNVFLKKSMCFIILIQEKKVVLVRISTFVRKKIVIVYKLYLLSIKMLKMK